MKIINTFLNLFFLAGTMLLLLFIIMAGSGDHTPLNFYWVRADTSNISGAYSESAWSFWGVCSYPGFKDCQRGPAYPISPKDNFQTLQGVPSDLVNNRDNVYYLSRFGFCFVVIAICFTGVALIVDLLGFFFQIIDKIVSIFVGFALFFIAGYNAFYTSAAVLARNAFSNEGQSTKLGVKLIAVSWTSLVTIAIVFFTTCATNVTRSYQKHMARVNATQGSGGYGVGGAPAAEESSFTRENEQPETSEGNSGGIRFFKIKRNQKASDEEESI